MISLERFRELLGEDAPADEPALRQLRDELYTLAHFVVDAYKSPEEGAVEESKSCE